MKTVTNIEPNVDLIEYQGRKIFLIGTAHVSRASADLVETVVRREKPDVVALELCNARFQSIQDPERWKKTDIFEVVRTGKSYVLLAQLILASFQKKIAAKLGSTPGEEMMRGITSAKEVGASIEVIDREVRTTFKRAWSRASLWTMSKMIASLLGSLFVDEDLSEKQIEDLKQGDGLVTIMNEFSDVLPGVKETLIDERDRYMAGKLMRGPGNTVVAVVGAGHVPGMLKIFGTEIDLEQLDKIPPPRLSLKLLGWAIPALIVLMIVYGMWKSGPALGGQMIWAWCLSTGTFAAIGSAVSLAHPLTILSAFVAAPIAAIHPMIAAGWVAGLVEAFLKKPRVEDLATIADDVLSLRGIYRNRVSKVLLVIALTNIGCTVGVFLGAGKLAALLS